MISDPIEQWLYFFRRAEASPAEELTARLPDPVFAEATGVPAMIAKNPDERRLYNERLKLERDERTRNLRAREEGRQEGELVGRVKLLQNLNGDTPATEELLRLGMELDVGSEKKQVHDRLPIVLDVTDNVRSDSSPGRAATVPVLLLPSTNG